MTTSIETGKIGWHYSQTEEVCRGVTYASWYVTIGPIHIHISRKR